MQHEKQKKQLEGEKFKEKARGEQDRLTLADKIAETKNFKC
jgi:hypothetical protein